TGPGGGAVGYDAGKQVKGRKRHLVVDTEGTVLAALVTPANVQDPLAAPELLAQARARSARLALLWAMAATAGRSSRRRPVGWGCGSRWSRLRRASRASSPCRGAG